MSRIRPIVGNWYRDIELGQTFEVVALDNDFGTIEVQLIDGEICEYDFDTWKQMTLEGIEEPEDWRNAFELSDDDYKHWGDNYTPESWVNPLIEIETDVINGITDEF